MSLSPTQTDLDIREPDCTASVFRQCNQCFKLPWFNGRIGMSHTL